MPVATDIDRPESRGAVAAERLVVTGLWGQATGLATMGLLNRSAWGFAAGAVLFAAGAVASTSFAENRDARRRGVSLTAVGLVACAVLLAVFQGSEVNPAIRLLLWAPIVGVIAWESGLWSERLATSVAPVAGRWDRLRRRSVVLGHCLVLGGLLASVIRSPAPTVLEYVQGVGVVALSALSLFLLVWVFDAIGTMALTSRAAPRAARPSRGWSAVLVLFVLSSFALTAWGGPANSTSTSRWLVEDRALTCHLEYDPPALAPRTSTISIAVDDGGYTERIGPFDVHLFLTTGDDGIYFERIIGARGAGSEGGSTGPYRINEHAYGLGTLTGDCRPT